MSQFRCHILAAAASLPLLTGAAAPAEEAAIPELFELSRASNAALMQGEIDKYQSLLTLSDDFLLMSPFGGTPTHARDITPETMARMGRFFRNGDLRLELVNGWASKDMVALALIERSHVAVGDVPEQEWALRVTLVYKRDAKGWTLAHRHADPLVGGIAMKEAAELAARPAPTPAAPPPAVQQAKPGQ
ncbi:ketosteroid isomerase-like protein [Sphingopyxis sp. OAS728]|uniref:nuclear transport factor 2 family protein n=1 Tax=Sphingopyxis sp. OAS728 TaxID=2663823 RepID=UPI0017899F47|nr:nuclear transport factor 2 family protein [Sphingopyxis sp. OAS728]MBE1527957.1 ketosteroid isomerase-like protein [Sphingopyxis sp. OAS728]